MSPRPSLDDYTLRLDAKHLLMRSFLLGDRAGFVVYMPASRNVRDRTLQAIKWYGASGFGRSFFEDYVLWVERDNTLVPLDRTNQTGFEMHLDRATRSYQVGKLEVRETIFVPDNLQSFVVTLDADATFVLKPEFDMRFYQEFNRDFSAYRAEERKEGLLVTNEVHGVGPIGMDMQFFGLVAALDREVEIQMVPAGQRLVDKTYLKDERREKLVSSVEKETEVRGPDHAPIWDRYGTKVFSPARFRVHGPVSIAFAFGDKEDELTSAVERLRKDLSYFRRQKARRIADELQAGWLATGDREVDTAYAHVLTRFNDALVARDADLHIEPVHRESYYAIFAGNKYFMDAWKRDENVSLEALLATNDYETVRAILNDTWQLQDERTGRLPHIIRVGESLVYYSSDGTLWALRRLAQYTRESGDTSLRDDKMLMVEKFFEQSMKFVKRGLLPSGGIIDKQYLWETWEDTEFTPRDGYPVEIELLWLTDLLEFIPCMAERNARLADQMTSALEEGQKTFHKFVRDDYLVDALNYHWTQDAQLTPNGYIAFGLGYPLSPQLARSMTLLARDQLAGRRGIRSLAPRDWREAFPSAFLADPHSHKGNNMASVGIYNYHRGIEWEWLNPFFVQAELECGDADTAFDYYVRGQVTEALNEGGIGGLSELYDLNGELGADFQAWSMAGFIRSLHLFGGFGVDALAQVIRICPALPKDWVYFQCRRRVGDMRFDIEYREPSKLRRSVTLKVIDEVQPDYLLQIGIRIPAGFRPGKLRRNGQELNVKSWTYQELPSEATPGILWTECQVQRNLRVELELEPEASA